MPAVPFIIAAAAAASAIDQRNRQKRAERKQDKLLAIERAQASSNAARERRQQIREARIAQGRIENLAASQGQQSSSAAIAGSANVQAQANENIGRINTTLSSSIASANLQQDIFKLQQPSDTQYVAGVVQSVAGAYGGKK